MAVHAARLSPFLPMSWLTAEGVQVLRHENADAIRAVRKAHPECSDKGGYDTLVVPEVWLRLKPWTHA